MRKFLTKATSWLTHKHVKEQGAIPAFLSESTNNRNYSYHKTAEEAYNDNPIVYRSIHLIAENVASVKWQIKCDGTVSKEHQLLTLLNRPNPNESGTDFLTRLVCFRLLNGNSYIQRIGPKGKEPAELHLLQPERITILENNRGEAQTFRFYNSTHTHYRDFPINTLDGTSDILHLKTFNPLGEHKGIPTIQAAFCAIDQHNSACQWNKQLLENSARPSGILVYKGDDHSAAKELRDALESNNIGRPMVFGGTEYEWKNISMTPRDMDFLNVKHTSARDIALTFGIPPQILGIPGDNTYSNLKEARLSFWEQTIIPLIDYITDALNHWLVPQYNAEQAIELCYNTEHITALAPRRDSQWQRINNASFLTDKEKKEMLGV